MNDLSRRWIEVAIKICANPYVKMKCPTCEGAFLCITIVPWPKEEMKVDVYLTCENCKAKEVITKNAEYSDEK